MCVHAVFSGGTGRKRRNVFSVLFKEFDGGTVKNGMGWRCGVLHSKLPGKWEQIARRKAKQRMDWSVDKKVKRLQNCNGFRADWFGEEKTTSISSATDFQGRVLTGYRGRGMQ